MYQVSDEPAEWTDNSVVQIGFLVPGRVAGMLIGKGGKTVKQLTKDSKCKHINFGEGVPELGLQLMVMKGTVPQLQTAVHKSTELLDTFAAARQKDTPLWDLPVGTVELNLLLLPEQVPRVIGKQGKKIKKLRSDSSTKMVVAEEFIGREPCPFVSITGSPANVAQCVATTVKSLPLQSWPKDRELFGSAFGKGPYEGPPRFGPGGPGGPGPRGFAPPMRGDPFYPPPMRSPYPSPRGSPMDFYDEPNPNFDRRRGRDVYEEHEFAPPKRQRLPAPQQQRGPPGFQEGMGWLENPIVRSGFAIPLEYAGILIGKKGVRVKGIARDSGCKNIKFGAGDLAGTQFQLCVMRGSVDSIARGVEQFCAIMASPTAQHHNNKTMAGLPPGIVEAKLLVDATAVPKIIGKKGAKITMLQRETDTKMSFDDDPIEGEKVLSITGDPVGIAECILLVMKGLPADDFMKDRPLFALAGMDKAEKTGPLGASPAGRMPPAAAYAPPVSPRLGAAPVYAPDWPAGPSPSRGGYQTTPLGSPGPESGREFCGHCGNKLVPGMAFCGRCGNKV